MSAARVACCEGFIVLMEQAQRRLYRLAAVDRHDRVRGVPQHFWFCRPTCQVISALRYLRGVQLALQCGARLR
jgi:hypothetical protein